MIDFFLSFFIIAGIGAVLAAFPCSIASRRRARNKAGLSAEGNGRARRGETYRRDHRSGVRHDGGRASRIVSIEPLLTVATG
ncbi:MAG: hypothetical protein U1E63_13210 [Burkholderiales bacterium]